MKAFRGLEEEFEVEGQVPEEEIFMTDENDQGDNEEIDEPQIIVNDEKAIDQYEETNVPAEAEQLDSSDEEFSNDIEDARQNLKTIMDQGEGALDEMRKVAQATEHPRAYEVMSTMMRSMIDANKAFIDVSEKKHQTKKKNREQQGPTDGKYVQNNQYVFNGNAADIISELENQEKDGSSTNQQENE